MHALQVSKPEEDSTPRESVWIVGLMRSGSSTILSMMSSTIDGNEDGGEVFSSFEPCDRNDNYSGTLKDFHTKETSQDEDSALCGQLVLGMSKCDFSEVQDLHNWGNPHSTNGHTANFDRSLAESLCKKSHSVAVKTVLPIMMENVTWVLEANPKMKIIEVVRDPRGMYASHAAGNGIGGDTIEKLCGQVARNLDVEHTRIHRVVFEELVKNPWNVTKGVFKFLGRSWGKPQEDWVRGSFNSDCDETQEGRFNDCHSDSAAVATSWKESFPSDQNEKFSQIADCVAVAHAYGYE